MVKDLIKKYNDFGDSIIKNVFYNLETKELIVNILVININENYNWDFIQINFLEVIKYRFIQNERISNSVVLNAYIVENEDHIQFDFFPTENEKMISLNEESDFMIKCKEIKFKKIQ